MQYELFKTQEDAQKLLKSDIRKRAFSAVVYPESLPDGWLDKLKESCDQVIISPLHDKDENPDGKPKKPHYHVIMKFINDTKYSVVKTLIVDELHQPWPQVTKSLGGSIRYMVHADHPDKFQYDKNDIQSYGVSRDTKSIGDYFITSADLDMIFEAMMDWIEENDVKEIKYFVKEVRHNRDWHNYIRNHYTDYAMIKDWITSNRHEHD